MRQKLQNAQCRADRGFTLLEMMIVILIVGVLAAIVAPAWTGFINRVRLSQSQDAVYWAMQRTKENAKRDNTTWQFTIRQLTGKSPEWAVHRPQQNLNQVKWEPLHGVVEVDFTNTTLPRANGSSIAQGQSQKCVDTCRMQFNHQGRVVMNPQEALYLGRITLKIRDIPAAVPQPRRCIFTSTILGTLRKAGNQSCVV